MIEKKIVYVDMDGVLVDLDSEINKLPFDVREKLGNEVDNLPELFENPKPIEGAVEAFHKLCKVYDVYILSTAPWGNPLAWMYKRKWVEKHLGHDAHKRLTLTHHKNLLKGDYLIDDRLANGSNKFGGELIHFGTKKFENWKSVLTYLNIN